MKVDEPGLAEKPEPGSEYGSGDTSLDSLVVPGFRARYFKRAKPWVPGTTPDNRGRPRGPATDWPDISL